MEEEEDVEEEEEEEEDALPVSESSQAASISRGVFGNVLLDLDVLAADTREDASAPGNEGAEVHHELHDALHEVLSEVPREVTRELANPG